LNRFAERNVVGYFENKHSTAYETFEALAGNLKDDCKFWAGVGEGTKDERISGDNIVFKPKGQGNSDQVFMGDITNSKLLMQWVHDKCVPLVRQITFQNGEELTEEGLPFIILFHKKEDTKSLNDYQSAIEREAIDQRGKVNFLHADCQQFSHPLFHLGKSVNDCPVIAIDSFKHMYNFPKFQDIHINGKLKKFILDLHSGKLHREFHDGPDPTQKQIEEVKATTGSKVDAGEAKASEAPLSDEDTKVVVEVVKRDAGQDPDKAELVVKKVPKETIEDKKEASDHRPVESQFAKLKPSHLKYSMKDEL
jgi:endoplasmic reticulum resident protein 44